MVVCVDLLLHFWFTYDNYFSILLHVMNNKGAKIMTMGYVYVQDTLEAEFNRLWENA